jgi:hypothetical protein
MFTIRFKGTGEYNTVILPLGQKMNSTYFMEHMLVLLTEVCYTEGSKPHERTDGVHFDNAAIHNAEVVQEHLANLGFTRIEHPPYSPDLAPYDFLLFGTMIEKFSGQPYECVGEAFLAVEGFLGRFSADLL